MQNPIEAAVRIAIKAHSGQVDKAGQPYILHPLRLMLKMENETEMIAAALHDVLEDSDYTPEELLNEGIPYEAVECIRHLTRNTNETYENFIHRVTGNTHAVKVKIADLEDNMTISRLNRLTQKDLDRLMKYHKALTFLMPYRK